MDSKPDQKRTRLLERFRAGSVERLSSIAISLRTSTPSEEAVTAVRQALQTIQGEAHMLGLASLSTMTELVTELLMGRPTTRKFERAVVGVVLLRRWFEVELVEDQAASERLEAHRRQIERREGPFGQAHRA